MSHPMYPSMRDFVRDVANGSTAINRMIPVQTSMGDQVFHLSFPEFSNKIAEMEGVHPLVLNRTIQDSINRGCLERMNRSEVFHKKVGDVCQGWDEECQVPTLFEDRVQRPFDVREYETERDKMEELVRMIGRIEAEAEEGHGDRDKMEDFKQRCESCMDNIGKQGEILDENVNEYSQPYPKIWKELSLKPHSYYRMESPDSRYPRYAEKHVKKYVPETIQSVFDNGLTMPHFLERENRRLKAELETCRETLAQLHAKITWLHTNAPKNSRNFLMRMLDPSDSDGSESDSESDSGDQEIQDLEETLQRISEPKERDEDEEPEEDEEAEEAEEAEEGAEEGEDEGAEEAEEEEAEEEEEEGGEQMGGQYYMSFDKKKDAFSFF
jgi:hypothetical protein